LAFSPDGSLLASARVDGTAQVWELSNGRPLFTFAGHTSGVQAVAFSPDGNRLYSLGRDGMVRAWDLSSGAGGAWLNLAYEGAQSISYSQRDAAGCLEH
jgi:WD40 repeat protein